MENDHNIIKDFFTSHPFPNAFDVETLITKGLRYTYDLQDEIKYIFPDDITKKIKNVLVIGCGYNELIYHCLRNPKIKFVGVDFLDSVENHINSSLNTKNFKFIKDDFMNLGDEKFDIIIASDVVNFTVNPKESISFLNTILEDQGALILSLPSSYYYSSVDLVKSKFDFLNFDYHNDNDVDTAFTLVKNLIQVHPSRINIYEPRKSSWISREDFIYRFMTPYNHSYNIYELFDLFEDTDLFFQNWFDNAGYYPKAFLWDKNPDLPKINEKFLNKDHLDIWDTVLTLKGPFTSVQKHTFCLRKNIDLNFFRDFINNDKSFVYTRPNQIISENSTRTSTLLARTNYKRTLSPNEAVVLDNLKKPRTINSLLNSLDFSLAELSDILQYLWEYSAISFYRGEK